MDIINYVWPIASQTSKLSPLQYSFQNYDYIQFLIFRLSIFSGMYKIFLNIKIMIHQSLVIAYFHELVIDNASASATGLCDHFNTNLSRGNISKDSQFYNISRQIFLENLNERLRFNNDLSFVLRID